MINELKAMAIFAEVAKKGSFREAAKTLSLSPSVVSYHIAQLEKKTGSALIYRSTRKLTLSHEGEVFYQQVLMMLEAAQKGMSLLSHHQHEPTGAIKISLPTALSNSSINHAISSFALQHPKVNLNVYFSDSLSDAIDEGVDLTIRAGNVANSDFKSFKLGEIDRVLVCSPAFYQKQLPPKNPNVLSSWPWLKLEQLPNKRIFRSASTSHEVEFNSQITVNSVEAIYHYCLLGNGLAVLAKPQVEKDLLNGSLIQVLPNWQIEPLPLFALWPKNIKESNVTKLLLSSLKAPDNI